jgi:hypothetical protein
MPAIPTINAGNLQIRASDEAVNAWAQAGRRIGVFFNQMADDTRKEGQQIGNAVKTAGDVATDLMDHQQIANGVSKMADANLSLEKQWSSVLKGVKDPNDPTVGQRFMEGTVQPMLEKFNDSFSTKNAQQWAEDHIAKLKDHWQQKTLSDQGTLAGEAVKFNLNNIANKWSASAAQDPAGTDKYMALAKDGIDKIIGSSPMMSPELKQAVSSELTQKILSKIAHDGLTAGMLKDPDYWYAKATEKLPDGSLKYGNYVNGSEMLQFQKEAIRAKKADEANSYTIQEHQMKQASEKNAEQIVIHGMGDNPTIKPSDVLDTTKFPEGSLTPQMREHMFRALSKDQGETPTAKIQTEYGKLSSGIASGQITNKEDIAKALADKRIDPPRYLKLTQQLDKAMDPNGDSLKYAREKALGPLEQQIAPNDHNHVRTEDGWARVGQLRDYAIEQEQWLAAHDKNPHELYMRSSPYWLGNTIYAKPYAPVNLLASEHAKLQNDSKIAGPPAPTAKERRTFGGKTYELQGGDRHDKKNWTEVK